MAKQIHHSLLLLGFGVFNATFAQQPFPMAWEEPQWNVLSCLTGVGTWCHTSSIQFVDSVYMCGHPYSAFLEMGGSPVDTAYVRNEGQRTWLRRGTDCSSKEYRMYDYYMEIGDTVFTGLNMDYTDPDTAMFILQSIDTVDLYDMARRRFTLQFDPCNGNFPHAQMQWIEGIGSTTHPFYPVQCSCDFCEQGLLLLCFDSSAVQLYVDPYYQTCDTIITAIDEPAHADGNMLSVISDGTARSLWITVDERALKPYHRGLSLVLKATDGRVVRLQSLASSAYSNLKMDVASVAPGTYILSLSDGSEMLAHRRLVIQ